MLLTENYSTRGEEKQERKAPKKTLTEKREAQRKAKTKPNQRNSKSLWKFLRTFLQKGS